MSHNLLAIQACRTGLPRPCGAPAWRTCICSTRPSLPQNSSTVGRPVTSNLRLSACGWEQEKEYVSRPGIGWHLAPHSGIAVV